MKKSVFHSVHLLTNSSALASGLGLWFSYGSGLDFLEGAKRDEVSLERCFWDVYF